MNRFTCKNCHLDFDADTPSQCPRCSSASIFRKLENKPAGVEAGKTGEVVQPRRFSYTPIITDTKESWMKFHGGDIQQCPGCGGKDFEFIWKRKEKVCKKCGEIMPLKRR